MLGLTIACRFWSSEFSWHRWFITHSTCKSHWSPGKQQLQFRPCRSSHTTKIIEPILHPSNVNKHGTFIITDNGRGYHNLQYAFRLSCLVVHCLAQHNHQSVGSLQSGRQIQTHMYLIGNPDSTVIHCLSTHWKRSVPLVWPLLRHLCDAPNMVIIAIPVSAWIMHKVAEWVNHQIWMSCLGDDTGGKTNENFSLMCRILMKIMSIAGIPFQRPIWLQRNSQNPMQITVQTKIFNFSIHYRNSSHYWFSSEHSSSSKMQ